jgi:hypothetical protein
MKIATTPFQLIVLVTFIFAATLFSSCGSRPVEDTTESNDTTTLMEDTLQAISKPLVSHIYTADPSAHVFGGRIYIYPSHDIDAGVPEDDLGSHFDMKDYHVLSMDTIGGKVTDHGIALDIKDIAWAGRQLWAPDAAFNNGKYYLYFPAKDKKDVFAIGVAVSDSPAGPFKPEAKPIEGSYSIDPAVFKDSDGKHYMYFGGIWGGQLQRWAKGKYDENGSKTEPNEGPALRPRVVRLSDNMVSFAEPVKEVEILDENGKLLLSSDHNRRFFEASWVHKYNGKYYFSYSTGDTHLICYAVGDSPYGPFNYKGVILNPVLGWTNHHSIVEVNGTWYLFYHDSQLSGKTHLRNIKVTPLQHEADGSIKTISAYAKPVM